MVFQEALMKQYFKIGEISKLYQISVDTLRYYEELGLLTPKRGENGYRLYRLNDIWRLNVIRDLRGLGFPMERIREYLNDRSIHTTEQLLRDELDAIRLKITDLTKLQSNVQERLATIRKAEDQPLETVTEKWLPARSCHILHSGYQKDEEMDVLMKQLFTSPRTLSILSAAIISFLCCLPHLPGKEITLATREYFSLPRTVRIPCRKDVIFPTATMEAPSTMPKASRNCSPTPRSMDLRPGHGFLSCSGLISISLRTRMNTSQNFSFLSPERRTSPFFGDVLF